MTKEELIAFLKDSLTITADKYYGDTHYWVVGLRLEGQLITTTCIEMEPK